MDGDSIRMWAAAWTGHEWNEEKRNMVPERSLSDADLSEAVRVKFLETKPQNFPGEVMWELMRIMMYEGPSPSSQQSAR